MNVGFKMNGYIVFLATILANIYFTNAYVLLQVRNKGYNHSDIDAVIHRTVPNDKLDILTKKIARKHNANQQPEMRSRHVRKNEDGDDDKGKIFVNLEVLKNNKRDNKTVILRTMEQVVNVVLDKVGKWTSSGFNYRSKDPLVVPKHVSLRSKPSLMYEVNTNGFLDALSTVLASEPAAKFVDTLSKNAALVYRSQF